MKLSITNVTWLTKKNFDSFKYIVMIWTDLSWFSSYLLTNRLKFDLILKKNLKPKKY